MAKPTVRPLWNALDFKLSEILRLDLLVGVAGAAGAVTLALVNPDALMRAVPTAATLVGVIIGAVLAGVAVQAAFMDQAFLRKLRAINRDPVRYLAPFLFTGVSGVVAMFFILIISAMTKDTQKAVLAVSAGLTGGATAWSLASVLPCLSTLVQFVGLKMDALDVPDDIDIPRRQAAS